MAGRRGTDASQLKFPLQLVILIIATMAGVYASNYASKSSIRDDQAKQASDVRDILTRLEFGAKVADAEAKADVERFNALKASIDATSAAMKEQMAAFARRQEMQQIQISQLSDAVSKLTPQGRK